MNYTNVDVKYTTRERDILLQNTFKQYLYNGNLVLYITLFNVNFILFIYDLYYICMYINVFYYFIIIIIE